MVCAVLVKKDSDGGAVRVTGSNTSMQNIVTGPTEKAGFDIILIRDGQTCMLLGNPTIRYIRRLQTR